MDTFSALAAQLRQTCPVLELREREPMARHTSFQTGGPVRLMALPKTEEEAAAGIKAAAALGITPFFMGNGSNLLVADQGVEVFLIKSVRGLERMEAGGPEKIEVGSGCLLSRIANFALERGLTGLEFAHGIPGSLGGGITMNAGAYGGELCQVVEHVTYLTPTGEMETIPRADCDFQYRRSAFSGGERLILRAGLALKPGEPGEIRAKMEDLAARRREKQPLGYPSAGSTFKRPSGHFAAALIESCGLKGASVGGAQVSEKHAGFVINRGGATSGDILRLTERIRETVLQKTGVALELEIRLLGF
ncbi:UDP-N-acetylmuramate dehydrogenase [Pseudoflavonifractor sp. 524-17]|uniref:UDP-N-acetylmuramate dehydrogenase n=1 Tax=Pseudoflavonifractor sp. 524-17 TaxID=2304577 RepID=UPI00137B662D|nr:UDP-N-acetylmuramate dehydrogenase [Pseudoflavonifractor sp. 524-17]NCE65213.1 UDP-N-acetylmuramate dehydrogenase [Pseudoflavonifractor sp. 524-17]